MGTQGEYTAGANAGLKVLDDYVKRYVPDFMGYRHDALAKMPGVAGAVAKAVIDAVDEYRAHNAVVPPKDK